MTVTMSPREAVQQAEQAPSPAEPLRWVKEGIEVFEQLRRKQSRVTYAEWHAAFRGRLVPPAGGEDPNVRSWQETGDSCLWVWKTLLSVPGFGTFARRNLLVRRADREERTLFPPGTEFIAAFQHNRGRVPSKELFSLEADRYDVVLIRTQQELTIKRGKSGHLEWGFVKCDVWIPVRQPRAPEIESAALGEAVEDIQVYPHALRGTVNSLNEAYAVASRRLEPLRRSHNGNVNDCLVWTDREHAVPLGSVRDAVHMDIWETIDTTQGLHRQPLYLVANSISDGPWWPCDRVGRPIPREP